MSYQLAAREVNPLENAGADDAGPGALDTIVGRSQAIRVAIQLARRFAARGATNILLDGETGTGKGVFALGIHYAGGRPEAPFVAVNCAAIPPSLLEAELFGYERGAFTDAKQTKQGLLELAGDGTLLLDEVSSLPLDLQPKFLRALEERRVRRVGGVREIEIRARVVAATNQALEPLVTEGLFREDLFYRLNVLRIVLPPLRARPGDVKLLADHFLDEISAAQGHLPARILPVALDVLETHDWPGNVRELKNVIERALALSEGRDIDVDHIVIDSRSSRAGPPAESVGGGVIVVPPGGRSLRSVEAELIAKTLELTEGNKSAAARILGISRPTLHKKFTEYGLGRERSP